MTLDRNDLYVSDAFMAQPNAPRVNRMVREMQCSTHLEKRAKNSENVLPERRLDGTRARVLLERFHLA